MPATDVIFIAELRNKVEQLVESGMNRKDAIRACDSECKYNNQTIYIYIYRQFKVEICASNSLVNSGQNTKNAWDSNIHLANKTVVTIGSYETRLEAALMAERMINKWH